MSQAIKMTREDLELDMLSTQQAPEPPSDLLTGLKADIDFIEHKQQQVKELESQIAALKELKNDRAKKVLAYLAGAGLERVDAGGGYAVLEAEVSARVPKTREARESFFDYLKQQGVYDSMITVNSRTLNSWVKAESESQLEQGNVDFRVPGIEISNYYKLKVKTKK